MYVVYLPQVISQQLSRLQDVADKCKSLTKSSENQLAFLTLSHASTRDLLQAGYSAPLDQVSGSYRHL